MSESSSVLLDRWTQENKELVNTLKKEKERERDVLSPEPNQHHVKLRATQFHKLLRKIQGLPPLRDHIQLELCVVYNACLLSIALSQVAEAESVLKHSMGRVVQLTGNDGADDPSLPGLWRDVLKSVDHTTPSVLHLFCLQWAIWLANGRLETIQELKEDLSSLSNTPPAGVLDPREKNLNTPVLVMNPRRLFELLQICTCIARGADLLNEGQSSEALTDLQAASSLAAPRTLIAYTHLLSGSCLAHMLRRQMALQCYRKALETDSSCLCALYRSMLIYREMGHTQAEIEALHLLYSTSMVPSAADPVVADTQLLSPALLLRSQSLTSLLYVPPARSVLHSLAQKCALHGRVSEGVQHYLDLLAALHSENPPEVLAEVPDLPRLPELYLEAGMTLLMARRPVDCMTLCDEVITATLELLPDTVVLEEAEEQPDAGTGDAEGDHGALMLQWTCAAYLLQGHCHSHLNDWKQSVIHYTRCINLLVKVYFRKKGCQPQIPSGDMLDMQRKDVCVLQRLKGLSLACRGISFTQTEKLREALRDLQLSLQAFPECVSTGLWCGEVFWRLGRRREAAACWEKTWNLSTKTAEDVPVYLQEPQSGPTLDSAELRHRLKELSPP